MALITMIHDTLLIKMPVFIFVSFTIYIERTFCIFGDVNFTFRCRVRLGNAKVLMFKHFYKLFAFRLKKGVSIVLKYYLMLF